MHYYYPKIDRSVGYAWNMLQRIYNKIGLEPTGSGDVGEETYLVFSRALTTQEKSLVDVIMADNPTLPPVSTGPVFIIRDIWNQKSFFETQIGMGCKIYYSESTPGSRNVDQIEIHFDSNLTSQQRNKILSEYGKLIFIK